MDSPSLVTTTYYAKIFGKQDTCHLDTYFVRRMKAYRYKNTTKLKLLKSRFFLSIKKCLPAVCHNSFVSKAFCIKTQNFELFFYVNFVFVNRAFPCRRKYWHDWFRWWLTYAYISFISSIPSKFWKILIASNSDKMAVHSSHFLAARVCFWG